MPTTKTKLQLLIEAVGVSEVKRALNEVEGGVDNVSKSTSQAAQNNVDFADTFLKIAAAAATVGIAVNEIVDGYVRIDKQYKIIGLELQGITSDTDSYVRKLKEGGSELSALTGLTRDKVAEIQKFIALIPGAGERGSDFVNRATLAIINSGTKLGEEYVQVAEKFRDTVIGGTTTLLEDVGVSMQHADAIRFNLEANLEALESKVNGVAEGTVNSLDRMRVAIFDLGQEFANVTVDSLDEFSQSVLGFENFEEAVISLTQYLRENGSEIAENTAEVAKLVAIYLTVTTTVSKAAAVFVALRTVLTGTSAAMTAATVAAGGLNLALLAGASAFAAVYYGADAVFGDVTEDIVAAKNEIDNFKSSLDGLSNLDISDKIVELQGELSTLYKLQRLEMQKLNNDRGSEEALEKINRDIGILLGKVRAAQVQAKIQTEREMSDVSSKALVKELEEKNLKYQEMMEKVERKRADVERDGFQQRRLRELADLKEFSNVVNEFFSGDEKRKNELILSFRRQTNAAIAIIDEEERQEQLDAVYDFYDTTMDFWVDAHKRAAERILEEEQQLQEHVTELSIEAERDRQQARANIIKEFQLDIALAEAEGRTAEAAKLKRDKKIEQNEQEFGDNPELLDKANKVAEAEYQNELDSIVDSLSDNKDRIKDEVDQINQYLSDIGVDVDASALQGLLSDLGNTTEDFFSGLITASSEGGAAMEQFTARYIQSILQQLAVEALKFAAVAAMEVGAQALGAPPGLIIRSVYGAGSLGEIAANSIGIDTGGKIAPNTSYTPGQGNATAPWESFHGGGQYRSNTSGGEGWAMLEDKEFIFTPEQLEALRPIETANDKSFTGGMGRIEIVDQRKQSSDPFMVAEAELTPDGVRRIVIDDANINGNMFRNMQARQRRRGGF